MWPEAVKEVLAKFPNSPTASGNETDSDIEMKTSGGRKSAPSKSS